MKMFERQEKMTARREQKKKGIQPARSRGDGEESSVSDGDAPSSGKGQSRKSEKQGRGDFKQGGSSAHGSNSANAGKPKSSGNKAFVQAVKKPVLHKRPKPAVEITVVFS